MVALAPGTTLCLASTLVGNSQQLMETSSRRPSTGHCAFSIPRQPDWLFWGLLTVDWFQMEPTRKTARLACWRRALTLSTVQNLSYFVITNFSMILKSWSSTVDLKTLSFVKTSEASGLISRVCHADFFLLPRKTDTTSQPVKARKKRTPIVCSGLFKELMPCPSIHLKVRPWPEAIHSCFRPISWRDDITLRDMTRTSVLLALIMTSL